MPGRRSPRPPPAAPSSRPTQRRRHAVWPPCTTARPPSSGGFRCSPCWLLPASCHTPSAGGLYHVDAEVSLWRGFVGDPQAQVFDVVDRFVEQQCDVIVVEAVDMTETATGSAHQHSRAAVA